MLRAQKLKNQQVTLMSAEKEIYDLNAKRAQIIESNEQKKRDISMENPENWVFKNFPTKMNISALKSQGRPPHLMKEMLECFYYLFEVV